MDSTNKLLKIAYFDETSAIDYLSVFNGGSKDSEVKESGQEKGTQLIFSGLAFLGKMWRCHDALEFVQPGLVSM